jgi:hypothetical protein
MEGRGHGSQDKGTNIICFVVATIDRVEPLKQLSVTLFKRYARSFFFHFHNVAMVFSLKGKLGDLEVTLTTSYISLLIDQSFRWPIAMK